MKNKKFLVLKSVIALLLCISMLAGTTFAWFTDSVTSAKNRIVAGNLDVELEYLTANGNWEPVNGDTNVFEENTLWEPGHTEVAYLRVSNAGTLALKYQLGINIASETASVNVAGERFILSDHIQFAAIEDVQTAYADRITARAAAKNPVILSSGYGKTGTLEAGAEPAYVAIVVFMPEEVGNEANYATGYAAPEIKLGIDLYATQLTKENDSFGDDYDKESEYPAAKYDFSAAEPVTGTDEDGLLTEAVTVGATNGEVRAEIPTGVKVAEDAQSLTLKVQTLESSAANITVKENELARPMEVHIDGVAEDNAVPMLVTLKGAATPNLNASNIALLHVENGETITMQQVALEELDAHNEYYYDSATGDIIISVATFSEFVVIEDPLNPWKGNKDTSWYNAEKTEFTIANGDQLAGLAQLVDSGITFEGKTIKLTKDIELGNPGSTHHSFDPIGYGYEKDGGQVFKGTFDGDNHTISNLRQNGWELGLSYSTAGGGLFASVVDAEILNLNVDGAEIVMECIDMGTVVGYAYGTCRFENIIVSSSTVANYNRYTGGVVGEVNGDHTFKNVWVDSNTTLSALWGTFDPGVGGIIGGKYGNATVYMDNCNVACVLDVFNDVTSAYEWYAYRRCGMLIGETEETQKNENGVTVASASFLTCVNCTVEYGDWTRYTYCQFENEQNPGREYPWVRVQAGLNNEAYSNPRYGHPVDVNGNSVTNDNHSHNNADKEHMISVPFGQLYGGGQGVYGAAEHSGVTVSKQNYKYTISYMFNRRLLDVEYITDNSIAQSTVNKELEGQIASIAPAGYKFNTWVTAGSRELKTVEAGNTKNIILYASWDGIYTARFVDLDGNVIYEETFAQGQQNLKGAIPSVPAVDDFTAEWGVPVDKNGNTISNVTVDNLSKATSDITFYPVYTYSGNLNLTGVDEDGDGIYEYYMVESVGDLTETVTVPGYVNKIPVKVVEKLTSNWNDDTKTIILEEGIEELREESLAGTPDLTRVVLPATLKKIEANAFSSNVLGMAYKNISFTYNGTKADFEKIALSSGWDEGLRDGATVTCTDGYVYTLNRTWNNRYSWSWSKPN